MKYSEWVLQNEPSIEELNKQRITIFEYQPKISIIIPVYNISKDIIKETLASVSNQTYSNWELCIADASTEKIIPSYITIDERVKVKYIENKNIADNTNEALLLATGDYVTFLDHDDTLSLNALFEIVKNINETSADFLYSDEDKLIEGKQDTSDGVIITQHRVYPHFKPDWSPDTLRSYNYICHLFCIKKELLNEIGCMNAEYNGSQDYDIILRATEKAKKITHIPKMLYHWRMVDGSTALKAENKMYAFVSAKKALREHLKRIKKPGNVEDGLFLSSYKIYYSLKETPLISIIIPNHNQFKILKNCITSILKNTKYENYEILIIENNSTDTELFQYYKNIQDKYKNIKVINWDYKPFNYSKINNFGVEHANGEYILLLNNDITVINEDWLNRMVEYIIRDDVGIVGAKLYFPNDTIQHAGVVAGMQGGVGVVYRTAPRNINGYMGRCKIVQNMTIVTGACMLTKKGIFKEVGGLEEKLLLAFNDVDYCLKVHTKGYRIIWTPYAELYHHESLSRGQEDTAEKRARFNSEVLFLRTKWNKLLFVDGDKLYPKECFTVGSV